MSICRAERAKNVLSKWTHFSKVGQILDLMDVSMVSRLHSSHADYNERKPNFLKKNMMLTLSNWFVYP